MKLNEFAKLIIKNDYPAINKALEDRNLALDFIRNINGIRNLVTFEWVYSTDRCQVGTDKGSILVFSLNLDLAYESSLDVNQRDDNGTTMLILAAFHGRIALVKSLLKKGADPTIVDEDGDSARIVAENNGYSEVIEILDQYLDA